MEDLLKTLVATPTATVLVLGGLAFLAVGAVGNVAGKVAPDRAGRIACLALGGLLLGLGLWLQQRPPTPASTAATGGSTTAPAPGPASAGAQASGPASAGASAPGPILQPPSSSGTRQEPALGPSVPPSRALVTVDTGRVFDLDYATFRTYGAGQHLALRSGEVVPFARLRGFTVTVRGPDLVQIRMELVDGATVTEDMGGDWLQGATALGYWEASMHSVRSVAFR